MNDESKDGLFRTTNPKTGKPYPAFRFHYIDRNGRQRTGTGDTSRKRTLDLKKQVQARERGIRRQWIDAPKESAKPRKIDDVLTEYLAYGRSKGGLGGRPWASKHAQKTNFYLKFWREKLRLVQVADLLGCLPAVERELSKLHAAHKAGKTLQNYAAGLSGFCGWCVEMEYLDRNPLEKLKSFDISPKTRRRALTVEEITKFLESIEKKGTRYAKRRRLGYEVAFASGLRKNELRSLVVSDLDVAAGGVKLHARWTKNRKDGFQHLPPMLVKRLEESATGKEPGDPLLFIARESSTALANDLERADIPKVTPEGKVDFHALRVAYTTLVLELGPDLKTIQTMTRHASSELTLMTYGRSRTERLVNTAKVLGEKIFTLTSTKEVQVVEKPSCEAPATTVTASISVDSEVVGREGFEPP